MSLNCFIKALLLFETSKETYVSQAEITHNALKIRKIVKSIKIWVFLKKIFCHSVVLWGYFAKPFKIIQKA